MNVGEPVIPHSSCKYAEVYLGERYPLWALGPGQGYAQDSHQKMII